MPETAGKFPASSLDRRASVSNASVRRHHRAIGEVRAKLVELQHGRSEFATDENCFDVQSPARHLRGRKAGIVATGGSAAVRFDPHEAFRLSGERGSRAISPRSTEMRSCAGSARSSPVQVMPTVFVKSAFNQGDWMFKRMQFHPVWNHRPRRAKNSRRGHPLRAEASDWFGQTGRLQIEAV